MTTKKPAKKTRPRRNKYSFSELGFGSNVVDATPISVERKAWEALWKAYITAIKAKKIDVAERLKKQIDGFDQKHFGKKV